MASLATVSWRLAVIGRWVARILGTLIALLFLLMALVQIVPAVAAGHWHAQLTFRQSLVVAGLLALAVGMLLAWKWEGLGGLLGVAGFVLLVALDHRNFLRIFLRMPVYWALAFATLLHLVCWIRLRTGAPARDLGLRRSRAATKGLG